jgi:hypothetical protein
MITTFSNPNLVLNKSESINFGSDSLNTEFTYLAQLCDDIWIFAGTIKEDGPSNQRPRHAYLVQGDIVNYSIKNVPKIQFDFLFNFINERDDN